MEALRCLRSSLPYFILYTRSSTPVPNYLHLLRPPLRFLNAPSLPSLSRRTYCYVSAVVDDPDFLSSEAKSVAPHPWPEWDCFLEKLRSKGYLDKVSEFTRTKDATDMSILKNACISFSRDRFDIFRFLSREDIQAVVESGCPNLHRKAVNSSKRLRAFLGLDEGDVCSACNLRELCDKAYVTSMDDDKARTVDIMRILLYYAVSTSTLSGEGSPIKESVKESARKLLSQLSKLSDTLIDPAFPKPPTPPPIQKKKDQKTVNDKQSRNVEMKRGDWLCPKCNFLNFARNLRCLECKEEGPKLVNSNNPEMKLGDWTCTGCGFMNYARNKKCIRCNELRPKRELNPGEWECPSCDYVNFRRNMECLKCKEERPEVENERPGSGYIRRKPVLASKKKSNFGDEYDDEPLYDSDDGGILPDHQGSGVVVSKRATLSERRLTSARK